MTRIIAAALALGLTATAAQAQYVSSQWMVTIRGRKRAS
jgi:general stress protein CsbA